ncbi:hypothetical protein QBC45DRAFT_411432 [Copromyces sp. CBS 386.78]|nr:hypothetical protein QBC45DRAFT_411432 [Copromyces sp. CBS 386.78]
MIHSASLINITHPPPTSQRNFCHLVVLFLALKFLLGLAGASLCPIVQRPLSPDPLTDKDLVSGIFPVLVKPDNNERETPLRGWFSLL